MKIFIAQIQTEIRFRNYLVIYFFNSETQFRRRRPLSQTKAQQQQYQMESSYGCCDLFGDYCLHHYLGNQSEVRANYNKPFVLM